MPCPVPHLGKVSCMSLPARLTASGLAAFLLAGTLATAAPEVVALLARAART